MTTKVLVVCPDHSTHEALVYTETLRGDEWQRNSDAFAVAPTDQAPPIYIDSKTRIVIEESERESAAQPKRQA